MSALIRSVLRSYVQLFGALALLAAVVFVGWASSELAEANWIPLAIFAGAVGVAVWLVGREK